MQKNKFTALAVLLIAGSSVAHSAVATRLAGDAVKIDFGSNKPALVVDFYGSNVFRLFQDPTGGDVRDPQATPPAQILVSNPRKNTGNIKVTEEGGKVTLTTSDVQLTFGADEPTFTVTDLRNGKTVIQTLAPVKYEGKKTTLTLKGEPTEYYYGGGVQNGRFSHKGKVIDIVNTNSWTDGGVASPTPFYWSTGGYGMMWHTFAPGSYGFGNEQADRVTLSHNTPYLDIFFMVSPTPVGLLNDFYQLTGNPVLLPKFGFYEGHLNAYNRDYWKEDPKGILYEDGKCYKESQTDNGGIKESLNGELPGNYQFSARAVIDRYNAADMPLGWVLPNDGYGAGYGQTSTLDGNIDNLREYGEYARKHGVEIGLWTQSDLHPKEGVEALLQRDIVKEVGTAGVRVLKTDVAWVGAGYSFGLNGVADVAEIMPKYGNNARPFIISLDGWAGTQRYAGIWSGDQTGGDWEYIRFHIPTYIGSGLSGQPNITSDMDGIFGGKNIPVNVRDYQWKTWTPMELNMDGWGANPKYPQQLGKRAADINRAYLKLKSELLPYAYTYAEEAIDGMPLIRAMFLDSANPYTLGTATRYQFLYGPHFLVAPIYQATAADTLGNDVRHNIYLPQGRWYDYFSARPYDSDGTIILNHFDAPLWKLPVFVKAGAIVPMHNPNNNPSQINPHLRIYELWPAGKSSMTEYDDDGTTEAYRQGDFATTTITSDLNTKGLLTITIDPTVGPYKAVNNLKATELRINCTQAPKSVTAKLNGKKLKLSKSGGDASWTYLPAYDRLAQYGIEGNQPLAGQLIVKLPHVDVASTKYTVEIKGFELLPEAAIPATTALTAPSAPELALTSSDVKPYSVNLRWQPQGDASEMEMLFNGMLYTNLLDTTFLVEDLTPASDYAFKLRAKNSAGVSPWTDLQVTTASNPYEFAIQGIQATSTCASQPGARLARLFDFDDREIWHSKYGESAVPFDLTMDLGSFNTLDRLEYLPRLDAGNGTILAGTCQYSENGTDWSEPVDFAWERSSAVKTITFPGNPMARYIKLHVDKALGNFGSGREIYVFKVPGTPSYIPGDINKDGKVDDNDLTSYTNYTGLRRGDGDFDYVSMGDVNRNGLIDAFDISNVATRLDGGIEEPWEAGEIAGTVVLTPNKKNYAAGDLVTLTLNATDLANLNALSFALPYSPAEYEYVGTTAAPALKDMMNLTYDRLHTSGDKVLYPTFVNRGDLPVVAGTQPLLTITFKARKSGAFTPKAEQIILVDKLLRTK